MVRLDASRRHRSAGALRASATDLGPTLRDLGDRARTPSSSPRRRTAITPGGRLSRRRRFFEGAEPCSRPRTCPGRSTRSWPTCPSTELVSSFLVSGSVSIRREPPSATAPAHAHTQPEHLRPFLVLRAALLNPRRTLPPWPALTPRSPTPRRAIGLGSLESFDAIPPREGATRWVPGHRPGAAVLWPRPSLSRHSTRVCAASGRPWCPRPCAATGRATSPAVP